MSENTTWFSTMQRMYLQKATGVIKTITEIKNVNIKPARLPLEWTMLD